MEPVVTMTEIARCKLVPIITPKDPGSIIDVSRLLLENDLTVIELTFRGSDEIIRQSIENLRNRFGQIILIGAGTVLDRRQVEMAVKAGADFIVSPGYSSEIAHYCNGWARHPQNPVLYIPGVFTSTEIMAIMASYDHLKTLKLFPADIRLLENFRGPFPNIRFIPRGGINNENAADYLKLANVFAIGSSWPLPQDLVEKKDYHAIGDRIREIKKILADCSGP